MNYEELKQQFFQRSRDDYGNYLKGWRSQGLYKPASVQGPTGIEVVMC